MSQTNPDQIVVVAGMHSILARQLHQLGVDRIPTEERPGWLSDLLEAVSDYYSELEEARNLLEQRLRATVNEVRRLENSLHDVLSADSAHSMEHYLDLFERTPVPTWEEDFSGVAAWLDALRAEGVEALDEYLAAQPDQLRHGVSLIEVTNANPAAARLVRAPDEVNLLGPLSPSALDDASAPSFIAQLQAIWDGVESATTEVEGSRFDGTRFDGLIEWRVLRSGRQYDYSRVLVTIVDISEQKAQERQARAHLKTRDEMIASVTHELRTPLTSVLGFAEILRAMDQADYEEERDGLLEIIANQAADLSHLVEDLLTSARAELGQLELASAPVDVHAQIAQAMETQPVPDREVILPARGDTPRAVGDPQRVRQILRNLLTNAGRYGGPHVKVEVESTDEIISVAVLDDGPGLAPGMSERVFERYCRDESVSAHPGSVGLGLSIARDLARRMEGDLVYERRGGWTVFVLTLPRLP